VPQLSQLSESSPAPGAASSTTTAARYLRETHRNHALPSRACQRQVKDVYFRQSSPASRLRERASARRAPCSMLGLHVSVGRWTRGGGGGARSSALPPALVGLGAVEAIGRFINQSPGCRQGTILAPVAAWNCPAAGPFRPWDILETSGSREARDQRRDRQGIDWGELSDACRAERSQLRSRKRALREQATPVWQDMTRAVSPATGRVTTCHGDHGRHGAGE
jgi:hypothetical protein